MWFLATPRWDRGRESWDSSLGRMRGWHFTESLIPTYRTLFVIRLKSSLAVLMGPENPCRGYCLYTETSSPLLLWWQCCFWDVAASLKTGSQLPLQLGFRQRNVLKIYVCNFLLTSWGSVSGTGSPLLPLFLLAGMEAIQITLKAICWRWQSYIISLADLKPMWKTGFCWN